MLRVLHIAMHTKIHAYIHIYIFKMYLKIKLLQMKVNNIWVQCKITQETKVINGGIESNKIYHKLITA